MNRKVQLGRRYRDSVTGFEGVATARSEYMNGCVRYALESVDKDGQPVEFWFDEQRLNSPSGEGVLRTAAAGGPRPAPPRTGTRLR